jgi:hypothetical protein
LIFPDWENSGGMEDGKGETKETTETKETKETTETREEIIK